MVKKSTAYKNDGSIFWEGREMYNRLKEKIKQAKKINNNDHLQDIDSLVRNLPEIYQNIYKHPEYDNSTSRKCRERENVIRSVVSNYYKYSGKEKLRVLDLGCAQGYYSFSLADMNCEVEGVDFLDKNIELCNALQKENNLDCSFKECEISLEMVDQLKDQSYDIILFLSVVHHITNRHGFAYAEELLSKLACKAMVVLTELAVKKEPLYWNKKLPVNYETWFENVKFYKELTFFKTHLSEIERPFVIYSNNLCYINSTFYKICEYKRSSHSEKENNGMNRYYICDDRSLLIKIFRKKGNLAISELETEINFINNNKDISFLPTIIDIEKTRTVIATVSRIKYGVTLKSLIQKKEKINLERILVDILDNCIELEERGFYQGDMRSWNIVVDREGHAFIIDFGFIQLNSIDCILREVYYRPEYSISVYDSFMAMVYECINNSSSNDKSPIQGGYRPDFCYDLNSMDEKYAQFFNRYLALKPDEVSFKRMKELLTSVAENEYTFTANENKRIAQKLMYGKYLEQGMRKRKWNKRKNTIKSKIINR